jgi:hypothetical protein
MAMRMSSSSTSKWMDRLRSSMRTLRGRGRADGFLEQH